VQAIQLGTSMAPILVEAARQMRDRRFMEVEKAGIIASQKILFPLIFCILPAVFLTIFAPLLIRWMTGDFFQCNTNEIQWETKELIQLIQL